MNRVSLRTFLTNVVKQGVLFGFLDNGGVVRHAIVEERIKPLHRVKILASGLYSLTNRDDKANFGVTE